MPGIRTTLVSLMFLMGCASGANTRPATPDEAAAGDLLAAKMVQAMGGMESFHKLRRISFSFTVRRWA